MRNGGSESRSRGAVGRGRRGFTLIEVMIVIAIILALSGLVGVALLARQKQAKADTARIDLNNIKAAMELFHLDYDRWPKEEEGIAVLWDKAKLDPEADANKWKGYLKDPMPTDRWGHEWGYRPVSEHTSDETKFDLWSNGPDGQEGTDDDITSWGSAGADGASGPMDAPPPRSTGGG